MKTLLIFLHGSGGNGRDLSNYFEFVTLDEFQHKTFVEIAQMTNTDIITPTAPERPYTPMGKMPTRAWFDRSSNFMRLGCDDTEDTQGTDESLQQVPRNKAYSRQNRAYKNLSFMYYYCITSMPSCCNS